MLTDAHKFLSAFICGMLLILAGVFFTALVPSVAQASIDPCPTIKSWEQRSQSEEKGNPDFYKEQTETVLGWLAEEPENAEFWAMLGVAAEAHGHNYVIRKAWETLPLMGTEPDEVIEAIGAEAHKFKRNRQDFAIAASRNALKHDDEMFIPRVLIGTIRMNRENYDEGLRELREALEYADNPVEEVMALFVIAQIYEKMGEQHKSEEIKARLIGKVMQMGGLEKLKDMASFQAALFPECGK